eukprot:Amastigsp_a176310_44.p2 type:complete len:258 gc:universal Amastigsp_a176310_44:796-23(-)
MRALDVGRRRADGVHACADRPRHADHADESVACKLGTNRGAEPVHNVHDTGREELRQFDGETQGREGRELARLEHDSAARGKSGRKPPAEQHQGIVPRNNLSDDTHRVPTQIRRVAGQKLVRGRRRHAAARARKVPENVGGGRKLVIEHGKVRLAAVVGLNAGEVRRVRVNEVRHFEKKRGAVLRRRLRPCVGRVVRSLHGSLDLRRRRLVDVEQLFAGGRVHHRNGSALAVDELAGNEHLVGVMEVHEEREREKRE